MKGLVASPFVPYALPHIGIEYVAAPFGTTPASPGKLPTIGFEHLKINV